MKLVTTAIESSWFETEKNLFLGKWCTRYSYRDIWSKLDYKTVCYHWDDRDKLRRDFLYLQELHETLLIDLSKKLNLIHEVNYSDRYWRIVIGPWLGYFVQMIFDRWESIKTANGSFDITGTKILSYEHNDFVPQNMADFESIYTRDEWNHFMFGYIIKNYTSIPVVESVASKTKNTNKMKSGLKTKIKIVLSDLLSIFVRNKDVFLYQTYTPFAKELLISLNLKQMPQRWFYHLDQKWDIDYKMRNWDLTKSEESDFENCVRALIPKHMPISYLEGYQKIIKFTNKLKWPTAPRAIWTSNAYNSDDVFKIWCAKKVENGALLNISQHGGHFGIGELSFTENHQVAICDNFLSWGWTDGRKKIISMGQVKFKEPLSIDHDKNSKIALVTYAAPRYSYHLYSMPISEQWLSYFDDQCEFVKNLSESIRENLTVRIYSHDYGWDQLDRWSDLFPNLTLDKGTVSMERLLCETKIFVATYNATTYLETISMNIPTVMFWNQNHWELRESAIPFLNELKRVGVFHDNPRSAALHIEKIWNRPSEWWNSRDVQEVISEFKREYSYIPKNFVRKISDQLK